MVEFVLGLNCQFQSNMKKYSDMADQVMHITCLFALCSSILFNLQIMLFVFLQYVRVFPLLVWPFPPYLVPSSNFLSEFFPLLRVVSLLVFLHWHNCLPKCHSRMAKHGCLKYLCNKYLMIHLIYSSPVF